MFHEVVNCMFYHPNIYAEDAYELLQGKAVGTFLLRPSYSYFNPTKTALAISYVENFLGDHFVTHERIIYDNSQWQLEGTSHSFESFDELIDHFNVIYPDGYSGFPRCFYPLIRMTSLQDLCVRNILFHCTDTNSLPPILRKYYNLDKVYNPSM